MADECSGKPSTLDQVCHSRIVEREGRRRRRRELRSRSQTKITSSDMHNEGQSSDDELLESTKIKLQSELGKYIHSSYIYTGWFTYCVYTIIKL